MKRSQGSARTINVSEFKAKALRLIEETARRGTEYLITKKGVPVAKVVPVRPREGTRGGSLKGLADIRGDIVHFDTSADWEANQE